MLSRRFAAILIVVMSMNVSLLADWESDLDELLKTDDTASQEQLIDQIVAINPTWQEVAEQIGSQKFLPYRGEEISEHWATCLDGVERPYVLYVPKSYDRKEPTPLLVILHGGVSRTNIVLERIKYAREHEYRDMAREHGWLALFPFGQEGATWWDSVGMGNIENQIRLVKREFNIDDDRVWLNGFSDGASAAFGFAMLTPTTFAGFLALNGDMGVPNIDGDLPTYAANLSNSPIYAVTTDRDALYPSAMMRPTYEMALAADADIHYREHEGGHDFTYGDIELPLMADWLLRHPRDPFPSQIVWETSEARYGSCRWFAIDEVTDDSAAAWHHEHNVTLTNERITIGFMAADDYEGDGVKVDRPVEGDYLANRVGLQSGDIIIGGGGKAIADTDALGDFKATLRRGDSTELQIIRDGVEIKLSGTLPPPETYPLFTYDKPSAVAQVVAAANRINIRGSRLGDFRVLVHPAQFRLEQNLKINVEGEEVYDALVHPDIEFMIRNFLENRDRKLLYVAELKVSR